MALKLGYFSNLPPGILCVILLKYLNGMLSNPLRYALFWSAGLFLLNAFIIPLLSGSEDITLFTVLGKAVIWGLAGVAIYFILKNKMKNNAK